MEFTENLAERRLPEDDILLSKIMLYFKNCYTERILVYVIEIKRTYFINGILKHTDSYQ